MFAVASILSSIFVGLMVNASAHATPLDYCDDLLSPTARAWRIKSELDFVVPGYTQISPVSGTKNYFHAVRALDFNVIGKLHFTLEKGETLKVMWLETESNYRGQGVAKLLFSEVLLAHPQIQQIATRLSDTNADIFWTHFRSHPKWWLKFFGRESYVIESLKQTPAYRIRAALGFEKIISTSLGNENISFVVERTISPIKPND